MSIEKINFSYPRGTLQSVYDTEEMTALELAAKTSKKVDECVDMVNGVEQTAIDATAIVDDMRIAQDQFMIDNIDYIKQDVNTKIDELITDGTIDTLINEQILNGVKDNITSNEVAFSEATGYGIINGLEVLAQSNPNMTVLIAPGVAHLFNGKRYSLLENATATIDAADSLYPRIDIIYISSDGVLTYGKGEAKSNPIPPTPVNGLMLAEIYVDKTDVVITTSMITDRRKMKVNVDGLKSIIDAHTSQFESINVKFPPNNMTPCVGDGVTDDSDALQEIIDYSYGVNQSIYIPHGTYLINKPLVFKLRPNPIHIHGAQFDQSTLFAGANTESIFTMEQGSLTNRVERVYLENLTLDGNHTAKYGIVLDYSAYCYFEKLQIDNFEVGMALSGWNNTLQGCELSFNDVGFTSREGNNNALNILETHVSANGIGLQLIRGAAINVLNSTIEGNLNTGIHAANTNGLNVKGCYFEMNGKDGYLFSEQNKEVFSNIIITGWLSTTPYTKLHSSFAGRSINISDNAVYNDYCNSFVYAYACHSLVVSNNALVNATIPIDCLIFSSVDDAHLVNLTILGNNNFTNSLLIEDDFLPLKNPRFDKWVIEGEPNFVDAIALNINSSLTLNSASFKRKGNTLILSTKMTINTEIPAGIPLFDLNIPTDLTTTKFFTGFGSPTNVIALRILGKTVTSDSVIPVGYSSMAATILIE